MLTWLLVLDETELLGSCLGLSSAFVPGSMKSPRFCLPTRTGARLRSILWESRFADTPSVKTSIKAREQKKVRTSFLDLSLNILGIF